MLERPNILIFNPDQFRADALAHMGNPASHTPNMDTLCANDGVSLRNAFCQNPVCTPSRCSFMTGWYPHVRGHRSLFHMLRDSEPVLLRTLKDLGYYVFWAGKNDLVPGQNPPLEYCSEHYIPTPPAGRAPRYSEDWRGPQNGDNYYSFYKGKLEGNNGQPYYDSDWGCVHGAIEKIKNRPADKPLCLYLPLQFPHPPYGVEEPWFSEIDRAKVTKAYPVPENWEGKPSILRGIHKNQNLSGWTEERFAELRAVYLGMCARIDYQFGMLVQALKDADIYDNTAIFVFSDHGDFTGDYGLVEKTQNTFEDVLTRVPFIIKPPSGTPVKPGIRDALVELVDFPATVEALLGITPSHTHFGRSLLPLIAGETDIHRDAVFCEGGRLHGEEHCKELESGENQVTTGLYWPRLTLQSGDGPEHTKATMCRNTRYKYVRRLYEQDELYDLEADPAELHNRINDPALHGELLALKERMLTFYQETADEVPHNPDKRGFNW